MKKNVLKSIICSLVCAFCVLVGVATVGTVSASAEEISSPETVRELSSFTLTQMDGAGVRYASAAEDLTEGGLRYEITMSKEDYDYIKSSETYKDTVSFGVFIAPRDYHDRYSLKEYIPGTGNVYCYDDGSGNNKIGGQVEVINIQTKYLRPKDENTYFYYATITNILEKNYSREFVGIGYIKYQTTDYAIEDGKEVNVEYYWATSEAGDENIDNARSIAWTASKLLETGKYKLPTDGLEGDELEQVEKENATRRDVLYSGYLEKSIVTIKFQSGDSIQVGQITDNAYTTNADSGMTMKYSYYNDGSNTFYQDQAVSAAGVNGFIYNCSDTVLHYDVWHAKTTSNASQYSQVLIFDASGMIVEGRDGTNGRWVTTKNVIRANAPKTTTHTVHGYSSSTVGEGNDAVTTYTHLETTDTADFSLATARCFDIPAGGFAIIVANGTTKTSIAYTNMQYGNYAKIYFGTTLYDDKTLTPEYVDQKPIVVDEKNALVEVDDDGYLVLPTMIFKSNSGNIATAVSSLGGYTFIDDNGTFSGGDDFKVSEVKRDTGNTVITLKNSSGTASTSLFTDGSGKPVSKLQRRVAVLTEDVTMGINSEDYDTSVTSANYAVNGSDQITTTNRFTIYTGLNKAGAVSGNFAAKGVAIILDKYGRINRVYDGANVKYVDAAVMEQYGNDLKKVPTATSFTTSTYASVAFASLQVDENLIVVQGVADSLSEEQKAAQNAAVSFALGTREYINCVFTLTGVEFLPLPTTQA